MDGCVLLLRQSQLRRHLCRLRQGRVRLAAQRCGVPCPRTAPPWTRRRPRRRSRRRLRLHADVRRWALPRWAPPNGGCPPGGPLQRRAAAPSPRLCCVCGGDATQARRSAAPWLTAPPTAQRGAERARPPQRRRARRRQGRAPGDGDARPRPGLPRQAAGRAPPMTGGGGRRWAQQRAALVGQPLRGAVPDEK